MWCVTCRKRGRKGHVYTAGHRRALQPRVTRRSRLSYAVREGAAPSWVLASRGEDVPEWAEGLDWDSIADFASLVRCEPESARVPTSTARDYRPGAQV